MGIEISRHAAVHKNAVLGKDVLIHHYAVIDENVEIGDGTVIGPHTHITGWTDIGKGNRIHAGVTIGDEPQDLSYGGTKTFVRIGEGNIFREGCTVHRGTKEGSATVIGNNNMFMTCSHVAHNCVVKDNVIMVNLTALGGYVEVDSRAFLSYGTAIHQFCRVGRCVMAAPFSKIGKDVPPFMLVSGSRTALVMGLNTVGLRRAGLSPEQRETVKKAYQILYHQGLNTGQALEKISRDNELLKSEHIRELLEFVKGSKRGISGPYRGRQEEEAE